MTVNKYKFPPCFGNIDNVFPLGKDGLREAPESCVFCCYKTDCIKVAINGKEGIKFRQNIVDRAYSSGSLNFFQRWSKRKWLQRSKRGNKS